MITGTPAFVTREGTTVTVTFTVGDTSDIISFECASEDEAFVCHDMWCMLSDAAIDYPVNAESDLYA